MSGACSPDGAGGACLAVLVGEPGLSLDEALAAHYHPRCAEPLMSGDRFEDVMGPGRGSGRDDPEREVGAIRWWGFEEEEATHMDLRRWFDERYAEGWRVMRIEAAPDTLGLRAGPLYQVVLLGNRGRHRERRLWPSEHDWLLRAWPVLLRTSGPYDGLLAT